MIGDLMPVIAAVITALATLASVLLGQKFMRRKEKDCIVRETAQNANVYAALQYLMEEMKGDRAYIMEFHNGDVYFSGRGQQKFSCTHEVVEEGISAECEFSQNHRVSNYHHYINQMINDGRYFFEDAAEVSDRTFHQMINKKGIKSIYNVPIKTLSGKIVGILGVDYVKGQIPKNDEINNTHSFMKRQARTIAGYLI
tara:strand:- start:11779 stop:12372 length:594 start_codon:yes stop_codon:yes gene_type:complete